jgi:hypothetical protein
MNTLQKPIPHAPAVPYGELAELLLHPSTGLIQATKLPALHELCLGLGEHYASVARGTGSSAGLLNLLPLLLQDAREEMRLRQAGVREERILRAVRLIWASPARGERGMRVAKRAWGRAVGR